MGLLFSAIIYGFLIITLGEYIYYKFLAKDIPKDCERHDWQVEGTKLYCKNCGLKL